MDLQDWVKTSNQLRVELEEPLQIGNGQTGPFSGSLPEVRLYNRGLSDTQVAEIFERQRL
ncbi:MAG: hypothetical protein OXQ27_04890 [Chloroflexota bacterium]|nr:hypothetical protein [Chloroflexota bacterium]